MKASRIRQTKIVATVGPACDKLDTLTAMMEAGMDVARLNLSHGTLDEHRKRVVCIRRAAATLGVHVAIMLDTRGVKIRTGPLHDGPAVLGDGSEFNLYSELRDGDATGVSVSYEALPTQVAPGHTILLDDGNIELVVVSSTQTMVRCRVTHGGYLHSNRSVHLPDTALALSTADPKIRAEIETETAFAVANEIDYVAASFVQSAADILGLRAAFDARGAHIPILAKIENRVGVGNLEAIVAASDGIMVARGDLGVELPFGEVPSVQKRMIRRAVTNGKPAITANQMLASMEHHPRPTRAEASDVANAILDGTSAVMLSGETAVGSFPVQAVQMMSALALRAEAHLSEYGLLQKTLPDPTDVVSEAVAQAVAVMARQVGATAIFNLTSTGFTARLISKHRPVCPILAVTDSEAVARRLSLNWGVIPLLHTAEPTDAARLRYAIQRARASNYVEGGDRVLVMLRRLAPERGSWPPASAGRAVTTDATPAYEETGADDIIRVMTVEE